ncbi:MAG: hypothetical protein L3J07_03860 [Candidatus Magasanikbacteria bacterium]|nr:hypothetical protein [Candidatus Magasanikbacteria bacterium]
MVPKYSLDLYKLLLDQKPAGLPVAVFTEGQKDYKRLEKEAQTPEQVEFSMISYGKKVWPFMQAQNKFLELYGEEKRKGFFLDLLPENLKEKWNRFESEGGEMHNYREGDKYENYFSVEEDLEIEKAEVEANSKLKEYILDLAQNEKKDEYRKLVEKLESEQEEMTQKIEELRGLKKAGSKWVEEIDVEIDFFKKGFAEIEERPTVEKIQGKIDFYQGQIDAGNK